MREPEWMTPDPWELEANEQVAEQRRQKWARYREKNRERLRAYARQYDARRKAERIEQSGLVGHLHELFCTGGHYGVRMYGDRRRCKAQAVYLRKGGS